MKDHRLRRKPKGDRDDMEDNQEVVTWKARGKMGVVDVVKWPLEVPKGHVEISKLSLTAKRRPVAARLASA
ncbi:unnamed protein product [Dovyalis caffra]|uniref:Uncharacterized protein n=1 Tax=Dovyalis caffra TaxID=77055 RepID=A0AAV1R8Z1_9ROSI|nr:unnamed protein product [Dovyalis caffra]